VYYNVSVAIIHETNAVVKQPTMLAKPTQWGIL